MISISLAACATVPQRIDRAGAQIGRSQAGISLPDLPTRCRTQFEHAAMKVGANGVVVLKLERQQLEAANAVIASCGDFYLAVKREMEAPIETDAR